MPEEKHSLDGEVLAALAGQLIDEGDIPIEIVHERHGGEDAGIKAREKFRRVVQAALEEYQQAVFKAGMEFDPWPTLEVFRTILASERTSTSKSSLS